MTCVFFDAICLQENADAKGNITADIYMDVVTRGFNLDNMIGAFFSALGLFSIARLGGIPVPSSKEGKVLWFAIMVIQVLEWILVLLSAVMIVLGYFHVRTFHRHCMFEAWGRPVADIASAATLFAAPVINQSLLVMFIYAYVISTCLKVWNATATSTVFDDSVQTRRGYTLLDAAEAAMPQRPHRQQSEISFEDRFENFKRELVNVDQKYPIATLHIWIAFVGLAISFVLSFLTGGILASLCFYPGFIAMVVIIKLTYAFVRWIEDDLFKGKFRVKVTNLEVKGQQGGRAGQAELDMQKLQVKSEVEQFGEVTTVKVHGEDRGEKRLAYALVTFADSKSADACLRGLAGTRIGRREVQVETASPAVRMFTGWFHDMSVYMAQPRDDYLRGFRVWAILQYPRLEFDSDYRESEVGQVDVGGGDAGFVNMIYGFSVFFVCIALAPATCYGVLIGVPVLLGSLPFCEAVVLVRLYYEDWWAVFTSFMTALANLEIHWDWPEWFNIDAIVEFINDCLNLEWYKMFEEALNYVLDAVMFLHFDLDRLIEGSRALLRLNSVLAALKPLLALLLKLWVFSTGAFSKFMSRYSQQFFEVKSDYLRLIFFGNCVPGQADIKKAATLRELARNQNVPVPKLKQPPYSYSAAELKLGKYKAKDLLVPGGFSVTELLNVHYPLQQMHEAQVESQELKDLNVPLSQMREAGYTPSELKGTFPVDELRQLQISASEMRDGGFNATEMREGGYSAKDMQRGGYSVDQLKDGGFGAGPLKSEGFTAAELKPIFPVADLKNVGFDGAMLRLEGFSAAELKASFSPNDLRAAGFHAGELREGGLTAKDIRDGGYSIRDLKAGGFDTKSLAGEGFRASELKQSFSVAELRAAGFDAKILKQEHFEVKELKPSFSAEELLGVGFHPRELWRGGFSAKEIQQGGCTVQQLKQGGFTADDLKKEGFDVAELSSTFTSKDMRKAGFHAAQLRANGYDAKDMYEVGYSVDELKAGGFNCPALRSSGFRPSLLKGTFLVSELRSAGFDAVTLRKEGFEAKELKVDFSVGELHAASFASEELRRAGFTARSMQAGGYDLRQLVSGGFTAAALKAEGFTAADLKPSFDSEKMREAGFSAAELKEGGFGAKELLRGGYDLGALRSGGFDASYLKADGFEAHELKKAFSAVELRNAGFTVEQLHNYFSVADLKAAGFSLRALKGWFGVSRLKPAFSIDEMRNAAFSVAELRGEFSAKDIHAVGFGINELKDGGFTADVLRTEGFGVRELQGNASSPIFSAAELRSAGFSIEVLKNIFDVVALKDSGYTLAELSRVFDVSALKAVFSIEEMKQGGMSARQLRDGGYDMDALRSGGFAVAALKQEGFGADELKSSFSVEELRRAMFTPSELKGAFAVSELKRAGFRLAELNEAFTLPELSLDFSPRDMKAGGISPREMQMHGGFNVAALKEGGFDAAALKTQGYEASELHEAFTAAELRHAGFDAARCKDHYSLEELIGAAFTTHQLKQAGFDAASLLSARRADGQPMASVKDLRKAHFLPTDLRDAGCSAADLREGGFGLDELKTYHVFRPAQLKEAGYSLREFKGAHYNMKDLKEAGFSPVELASDGFTAKQLSSVFSFAEMRQAFTASQMNKLLGLSCRGLRDAGYTASDTKQAGFRAKEMRDAGYDAGELYNVFGVSDLKRIFSIQELHDGGIPVNALKTETGYDFRWFFSETRLREAGYTAPWICEHSQSAKHNFKDGACTLCGMRTSLESTR